MITQTPWIERKFNFDLPIGLYPCLLERLRGTPGRIEEMVKNTSEEILTRKEGNRWSVKEQIGHLIDLESLHDGRIDDFIERKEILRAADMANKATSEANHNSKAIKMLVDDFRSVRKNFVSRLQNADENLTVRTSLHPRLKIPMRFIDMVFFVCEHDDHHLAKMRGLISRQ